jgi:hypothetical protein
MRPFLSVFVLAFVAAGCRSGSTTAEAPSPPPTMSPSPTPTAATPSPSRTRTRTPTPSPSSTLPAPPVLPPGVPDAYGPDDPAGDVPAVALIPPSAAAAGTWFARLPGHQGTAIVVTYSRGNDPFRQEHGLVVWRHFGASPHWRATFGFADRPRSGVLGIQVDVGDATADRSPDVLAFEGTGGTGDCGAWRVIQPIDGTGASVLPAGTCDTTVSFSLDPPGLTVTKAVFRVGDAHCCPSAYRISQLEWNGTGFDATDRHVSPAPRG